MDALILIVEDDPDIRELLRFNLEKAGFALYQAEDGEKALLLARKHAPDIILLDLNLPHMGGMETLGRLAQQCPDIPVIIVSGSGSMKDAIEALERGEPLDDGDRAPWLIDLALHVAQWNLVCQEFMQPHEQRMFALDQAFFSTGAFLFLLVQALQLPSSGTGLLPERASTARLAPSGTVASHARRAQRLRRSASWGAER